MQLNIHDNNPSAKFIVDEGFNVKEDEAMICIAMVGGDLDSKPAWKTIQFSIKDLKGNTFENELVEIVSAMLIQSAKQHHWTDWD